MLSGFIHQHPFVPIRPALASTAFTIEGAWKTVMRRSDSDLQSAANVLLQAMGIWADSALGKGKHGRGKGMSGDAYGRLTGKTVASKLATSARWGECVMGEQALTEYVQSGKSIEQGNISSAGDKDQNDGQQFVPLPSGFNMEVSSHSGEDEVSLMVWLARRK